MNEEVDQHKVIKNADVSNSKSDREQRKAVSELLKQEDNGKLSMNVLIHSPFREYYNGPAFSLSGENASGPFDILPQHYNFISLLNRSDLIIRTVDSGEQRISISGGIMHVKADRVIVFLDV